MGRTEREVYSLDGGDDLQGRPGEHGQHGRGSSLRHGKEWLLGMDLEGGDTAAGPQELQVSGLDVEEVEKVPGGVEQSVLVQDVEVVTAGAVVAEAVTESERLRAEVSSDVRRVVKTDLTLFWTGGLSEPLQHPAVHHMELPQQFPGDGLRRVQPPLFLLSLHPDTD